MTTLSRILTFALSHAWAMDEGTHRRMMQLLISREDGIKITDEGIAAAARRDRPKRDAEMRTERGVAFVPIQGVIAQRASAVGDICSNVGTSVEHIRSDLRAAVADSSVRSIVLEIDSPGGSVLGIDELAAEIRAARDQKPIVAHTDAMMASAAYYLGSQANRIVATRSSSVGSVGVIASFLDNSRALANRGYEPVVVKSTPAKGGVQSNGAVSDADRADVQREVDRYHEMFVESIAEGRGIDVEAARSMGDGRIYIGAEAQDKGYVDEIGDVEIAVKRARAMARGAAATESVPDATGGAGAHPDEEEPQMPETNESAAHEQTAATPTEATAPSTTPAAEPETQPEARADDTPSSTADTAAAERARASRILRAADPDQKDVAQQLIDSGTPEAEALTALIEDRRQRVAPPASASLATGNNGGTDTRSVEERIAGMPEGASKWDREWEASAEVREEFKDDKQAFLAYRKAESEGRIAQ
ncbi:MAG: S49 family peptidase [Planctomycetota bacterium]